MHTQLFEVYPAPSRIQLLRNVVNNMVIHINYNFCILQLTLDTLGQRVPLKIVG